jgi:hypothetical protein
MKKGPTALGADLEKREKRKAGATFNVKEEGGHRGVLDDSAR